MPVFHTKTIQSILDPVSQKIVQLVIFHEEAEDGATVPNLVQPIKGVSLAVENLLNVGKQTIDHSTDTVLISELRPSFSRVDLSSKKLEEAVSVINDSPQSVHARTLLLEGSRGVLEGVSSLLLAVDQHEVRKIIVQCKCVLAALGTCEIIITWDELILWLRQITPYLTNVSKQVKERAEELTHKPYSDILLECLAQIKLLTPVLICSLKVCIQITERGGQASPEIHSNRDYLTNRMTDEIEEIIRVLQLLTCDDSARII